MYFLFIDLLFIINVLLYMDMIIVLNKIVLIYVCSTKHHPVYLFLIDLYFIGV